MSQHADTPQERMVKEGLVPLIVDHQPFQAPDVSRIAQSIVDVHDPRWSQDNLETIQSIRRDLSPLNAERSTAAYLQAPFKLMDVLEVNPDIYSQGLSLLKSKFPHSPSNRVAVAFILLMAARQGLGIRDTELPIIPLSIHMMLYRGSKSTKRQLDGLLHRISIHQELWETMDHQINREYWPNDQFGDVALKEMRRLPSETQTPPSLAPLLASVSIIDGGLNFQYDKKTYPSLRPYTSKLYHSKVKYGTDYGSPEWGYDDEFVDRAGGPMEVLKLMHEGVPRKRVEEYIKQGLSVDNSLRAMKMGLRPEDANVIANNPESWTEAW